MRKTALVLLSMTLVCSCQTGAFEPIEIDLSRRTPKATATVTPTRAALPPSATPTPTPAPIPAPAQIEPVQQSPAPAPVPLTAAAAPKPGGVVDAQLDAYNRHDVEALVRAYAPDAVFYDFPDRVRLSGIEQIRLAYSKEFAESSTNQAAVSSRLQQGNFIIDHETVSGSPGREVASMVVIYEVRDGKIRRVWFLQ